MTASHTATIAMGPHLRPVGRSLEGGVGEADMAAPYERPNGKLRASIPMDLQLSSEMRHGQRIGLGHQNILVIHVFHQRRDGIFGDI